MATTSTADELAKNIRVFPNPVNDQLQINLGEHLHGLGRIYNTEGQEIGKSFYINGSIKKEVRHFPHGIYFVIINLSARESLSQKIIIN